ncbi:E3 ubiquitin-protein ligase RHA2B-like [Ipomoea triloba]|uniref:E3 ubiquitin-protein ligase RHA2B-like n=1 Tax=Ipomoea triloba TaxID=35885 RepID=UPI00125D25ED|nr:E3 ubiquitin-protein ligase RHA2B-like [Ipomoea triloba]
MRMRNASHAFIFIILIAICTFIFKKMLRMFPQSAILNYVVLAASHLKLAWDCLFIQSFCPPPPYKFNVDGTGMSPELGGRVFGGESEAVECAVCLCKIEEGEEVGDLRCNHIFHRDCLDRWLATGRNSCPLCRTQVKSAAGRRLFDDRYREVIEFDFFSGRRDGCTWWLR